MIYNYHVLCLPDHLVGSGISLLSPQIINKIIIRLCLTVISIAKCAIFLSQVPNTIAIIQNHITITFISPINSFKFLPLSMEKYRQRNIIICLSLNFHLIPAKFHILGSTQYH